MHSFDHVTQISALIREVFFCLIKEPVTVIPTPTGNHLIIYTFFFIPYKVLFIFGRRVHVLFEYETSWGDLGCPYLRGPFWPIRSSHDPASLYSEKSLTWDLLKVHGPRASFSCGLKLGRGRQIFPSAIMQSMPF